MPDQIGYFASLKNAAGKVFTYLASITLTGTDGKIITCTQDTSLDEAVAMSSKAPKASPVFTTQITTPQIVATANSLVIKPTTDATTAIRLADQDGNSILNVDTTNDRVGIGTTSPALKLDVAGAVRIDPSTQNETPLLQFADIFSDYVVTGLLPATSANLTSDISAGQAYVIGKRIYNTATAKTYTASKDTYVDVDYNGNYTFSEVANAGTAPAVVANSIRLAKVVTDADNITGVTGLRALYLATTVNGSERMRINSSGNIGIGTTEPGFLFDVIGGAGPLIHVGMSVNYGLWGSGDDSFSGGGGAIGNVKVNIGALGSTKAGGTTGDFILFGDATIFYSNSGLSGGGAYTPTERMRITNAGNVGIGTTGPKTLLSVTGPASFNAPSTKTAAYSLVATDSSLIFKGAAAIVLTLQAAVDYPGRILYAKTIAAFAVDSASSNVVPIGSDVAGTAILAATAGKWAILQSDGTNWVIMAAN